MRKLYLILALVLIFSLGFSTLTLGGIGSSYDGERAYLTFAYRGFFLDYAPDNGSTFYKMGINPTYQVGDLQVINPFFMSYMEFYQDDTSFQYRYDGILDSTVIGGGVELDFGPLKVGAGLGTDLDTFNPYNLDNLNLRSRAYLNVDFIALYSTLVNGSSGTS